MSNEQWSEWVPVNSQDDMPKNPNVIGQWRDGNGFVSEETKLSYVPVFGARTVSAYRYRLDNTETPEEKEEFERIEARQAADMVNQPPHYKQGDIECIDAIRAALTPEEFRGYCKGNALKYVWRELHKGGDESMKKATWYINKATEASARRAGELEG